MDTRAPDLEIEVTRLTRELQQLKALAVKADVQRLPHTHSDEFVRSLRQAANLFDPGKDLEDREDREEPELKDASEHLGYEIDMFFSLAGCLAAVKPPIDLQAIAYIEAFLTHARILHEFLYFPRPHPDTLHATDYLKDWERVKPDEPRDFQDGELLRVSPRKDLAEDRPKKCSLRDYINKEVAHLAYTRTKGIRPWRIEAIAHLMWRPIKEFCEHVAREEKDKLSNGFWERAARHL